jgi:short-subunit dehydrogenase
MIKGKVVIITGAGGGLGSELVKKFLEQESIVVGIGRSKDSLEDLSTELESNNNYSPYIINVADINSVKDGFKKILNKYERIDFLFNNAAVYPKVNFLEESEEDWLEAITINLGGVSNCCKAVLPAMIRNRFGRIYNVGSFADFAPIENSAAYSCSKGGLHALTKAIAKDIEALNLDIQVHEWVPGHLKTKMSGFTGIDPAISASWGVKIANGEIPASSNNVLFENDHEWILPKSIKQRIKDKVYFWK